MRLWPVLVTTALVSVGCAPVMVAPPYLVAAWPSANASLKVGRHTLDLTFNRLLDPEKTWAVVWRDDDGAPLATETEVDSVTGRDLLVSIVEPSAGQYHLRWHAVSARTAAATDGEQVFSMRGESMTTPRLKVSSMSADSADADSGDKVELSGSGFGKKRDVQLTIGDDEQAWTTVVTDNRGTFDTEVRVPPSVAFGVQPVAAVDAAGESARAALRVRWGGWPPLIAFTTSQSGPGSGEATFSVNVRNRSDYILERVQVTMNEPDGATLVAADPAPSTQDQTLLWTIPVLDRGVAGPFRATFRVRGPTSTHTVIGFRHRRPRDCSGGDCPPAFVSETTTDSTLQPSAE